jgi:mono/diheme cytochrome c family protein
MLRRFIVLVLFTGCAQVGMEGQPVQHPVPAASSVQAWRLTQGAALYIRYCSDCHGWRGRGQGPVARMLGISVPSLQRPELFIDHSEDELLAWILAGVPLSMSLDAARLTATEEEISAIAAYLRRLPHLPWEQIDTGRELYDAFCVSCHGLYARGDGLMVVSLPAFPRDLSAPEYQRQISDAELSRIIAEGRGMMPGMGDLVNPDQIEALVAYVRLLSPGHELYTRFCAICHGYDGHPAITDPEAASENEFPPEEMPQVVFNEAYFMTRSEAEIRDGIRHMLRQSRAIMSHFQGELSPNEVRQILSYLQNLQAP